MVQQQQLLLQRSQLTDACFKKQDKQQLMLQLQHQLQDSGRNQVQVTCERK
jgi:hypothetical protein